MRAFESLAGPALLATTHVPSQTGHSQRLESLSVAMCHQNRFIDTTVGVNESTFLASDMEKTLGDTTPPHDGSSGDVLPWRSFVGTMRINTSREWKLSSATTTTTQGAPSPLAGVVLQLFLHVPV